LMAVALVFSELNIMQNRCKLAGAALERQAQPHATSRARRFESRPRGAARVPRDGSELANWCQDVILSRLSHRVVGA